MEQLQQKIQMMVTSAAQKQQSYQQLEADKQMLHTENKELEGTVLEFRKEFEALMTDYQGSADRLHETEAERDEYKNQYETELRRAERIRQLERHRKEATERNEHLRFQVSVWHPTSVSTHAYIYVSHALHLQL